MVTSCGIEYEHTFIIVDFGKRKNNDIILGRPFKRQLKMVQDWGYNYIYLRNDDVTTRVNMKTHKYRDVTRTPVEEFDSATVIESTVPSWIGKPRELWMCGASDCESLKREESILERAINDEDYIPEPFLEYALEPLEWGQIMAMIDACAIRDQPTTRFCDPEDTTWCLTLGFKL